MDELILTIGPWLVMITGIASLAVQSAWKIKLKRAKPHLRAAADSDEPAGPPVELPSGFSDVTKQRARTTDADTSDEWLNQPTFSRQPPKPSRSQRKPNRELISSGMQVVISLAVLFCALFIIMSNGTYSDASQKWAFGMMGTIVGYWLKR